MNRSSFGGKHGWVGIHGGEEFVKKNSKKEQHGVWVKCNLFRMAGAQVFVYVLWEGRGGGYSY